MPRGPRILIKDDRDSALGRGAILYAAHFRPEMALLVEAIARAAARMGWDEITMSEGYRPKVRSGRDLHAEQRAFDFSLNHIPGDEAARYIRGNDWKVAAQEELGRNASSYQIVIHGDGENLHMHAELDP